MIKILIGIISRLIGYRGSQRLLRGYIYIVEDVLHETIRVGTTISLNKLHDIQRTYYSNNKYRVKVIHKTSSKLHKQRRDRLNQLQQFYINKYSRQYKVVLQI